MCCLEVISWLHGGTPADFGGVIGVISTELFGETLGPKVAAPGGMGIYGW